MSTSACRIAGWRLCHSVTLQRGHLVGAETRLTEDFAAVLAKTRRKPLRLRGRMRPLGRDAHAANGAFARMIDRLEEIGGDEMRVVEDAFEIVHRHHRNVSLD